MKYHLFDQESGQTVEVTKAQFDENQKRALQGKAARLQAKTEPKGESKPAPKAADK